MVPWLPRKTLGWVTRVRRLVSTRQSARTASSVRTSVPRLPGISTASATSTSADGPNATVAGSYAGSRATDSSPSGWPRSEIRSSVFADTRYACSARAASCSPRVRASSEYASSGHHRKVRTGVPAARTSRCAHNPSATSSRSRLDAVLCWMSRTCLIRGWDKPICCSSTARVWRTALVMTGDIRMATLDLMIDDGEDALYLQSFGRRLSALRVQRGLSQEELAEAAGLPPLEVRRAERG